MIHGAAVIVVVEVEPKPRLLDPHFEGYSCEEAICL